MNITKINTNNNNNTAFGMKMTPTKEFLKTYAIHSEGRSLYRAIKLLIADIEPKDSLLLVDVAPNSITKKLKFSSTNYSDTVTFNLENIKKCLRENKKLTSKEKILKLFEMQDFKDCQTKIQKLANKENQLTMIERQNQSKIEEEIMLEDSSINIISSNKHTNPNNYFSKLMSFITIK